MKTFAALTVLVTLLTGCFTSLGELRATEPVRSTIVAQPYRGLALCMFDGANSLPRGRLLAHAGDATYQMVDYQPAGRIAVIGSHGSTPPSTDIEILFLSVTESSTRVEMRLGFSGIGRERYERELAAVLNDCVTPRVAR